MFGRRAAGADVAVDIGGRVARAIGPSGEGVEVPSAARMTPRGWRVGKDALATDDDGIRRPVVDGRLADPDAWAAVAAHAIRAATPSARTVWVATHGDTTESDVDDAARSLSEHGLHVSGTVPGHLSAAVGAELPVPLAEGSLVVLAGGSRVEIAVISLSGTVVHRSVRAGLDALDAAIAAAVRRDARAVLTPAQIRRIRKDVVDASPVPASRQVVMTGRRLDDGTPVDLAIDGALLGPSIDPVLDRIASTLVDVLRETPPELCADLVDRGLILLGGGATQRGLDRRLQAAVGLVVLVPDQPALAIVRGMQRLLSAPELSSELVQVRAR